MASQTQPATRLSGNSSGTDADGLFLEGRHIYQTHCVVCHGRWGDGRGEMAASLIPRPRDFTKGIFKYRSTPSGFLPADADLERTIRSGFAGTAMPAFTLLRRTEIQAVIAYIKSFSAKWRDAGNHSPPLALPALPEWFEDKEALPRRIQAGKTLFESACASCHGADGSGKNSLPPDSLEDVWGRPAIPADLRQAAIRSGPAAEDIYRVLATGLNGTPMPSFLDSTTEVQRWELAAFILSLRPSGGP